MKPRLSRVLQRYIAGVAVACSFTVQADDLTWNGGTADNVWDTSGEHTPWQSGESAVPFTPGDNVEFAEGGLAVDTTVQVGEDLQAGSVTVDAPYTFQTTAESSISGSFSGGENGSITKIGSYLLTLESESDATSGPMLSVQEGELALSGMANYAGVYDVAEEASLSLTEAAGINLESGVQGSGALVLAENASLSLGGDSSIGTLSSAGTISGNVALEVLNAVTEGGIVKVAQLELGNSATFSAVQTDSLRLDGSIDKSAALVTTNSISGYSGEDMDIDVTRVVRGSGDYVLVAATDMGTTSYTLSADTMERFLNDGFATTLNQTEQGLVLTLETTNTNYYERHTHTANGRAGGELADYAFDLLDPQAAPEQNKDLAAALDAMDSYIAAGSAHKADALAASMAGAAIANLNMAWRDQMGRQLNSIRNRMTVMNGGIPCLKPESKECAMPEPQYTMWANAEIDYQNRSGDAFSPGYKLNSVGGTAGVTMQADSDLTVGAAFTGMAGRYSAKGYGSNASGDLDAYYASMFARMDDGCWSHSLIGSVGFADITLNRRVGLPGGGYATHGSTDGLSMGLMYEMARTYRIYEGSLAGAWWQPVFNVSYIHSSVDGFTEHGSDAALRAAKQESNNVIFGLGARMQSVVGENLINRPAVMETRLLGKAIAGRQEGKVSVSLPGVGGSVDVHGSEPGAFGVELGVGFEVPLGNDLGSIIMDCSAEFFENQNSVNGVLGYRLEF